MDKKYEVSGQNNDTDGPRSSIKPLTEVDLSDGAGEKMLSNDEKKVSPSSNVDVGDVKFTENQNGDAKLDIGEIRAAFVGMGKEELMKYANDPFWVRLRWFLFILFWLLWAAMLVGAVMIIYAAPKCESAEPKSWWEQGPLTEVELSATSDELKAIKEKGIQGIIVTWTGDAYYSLNNSSAFIDFLKIANATDINVILDLKPGTSTKWLNESQARADPYSDYYIWAKSKSGDESIPPNNWLRTDNQSAWTYNSFRKEYYYSFDGEPQLNFSNPRVVEEFSSVLQSVIAQGVKGIRLRGVPSLLIDKSLANETIRAGTVNLLHTDYRFYTHTKTQYLSELGPLVKTWRTIVKSNTGNGPIFLDEDLSTLEPFKVNGSHVIDLPRQSDALTSSSNATDLVKRLNVTLRLLNETWPLWEHTTTVLPSDVLDIVTFLLPGVTLVDSNANISQELLKLRSSPSIMNGQLSKYDVANSTLFAFIRVAPGNPGILVLLNPTKTAVTANLLQDIPVVSEEVTVQLYSSNYNETGMELKLKKTADAIPISPESALVLSYVPKKNE